MPTRKGFFSQRTRPLVTEERLLVNEERHLVTEERRLVTEERRLVNEEWFIFVYRLVLDAKPDRGMQ